MSLALTNGEDRLDAAEVTRRVERVAMRLDQDRVGILAIAADNSPDWVVADLAARRAGIPVVPLPPFFSPQQLAHVLADSGVDTIAVDEPGSKHLQPFPTTFAGELTEKLMLLHVESAGDSVPPPPGTAKISYTSGTTGTPRGVCLTRNTIESVASGIHEATRELGIERHLCLLPLATLLENVAGVYTPLQAGAEVAVPGLCETGLGGAAGFDIDRLLACLNEYRPGSIILLPQMLSDLVGALESGAKLPSSLRFAAVGGGVVGLPLLERADRTGIPVFEGYGLTECCSVVALNTPAAKRSGSVGRPLPHCSVRIASDNEVFVGGATMAGYLGEAPAYQAEVATGDVGYLDRDGYLFINGRKKNVFITSYGRNLSPEWIEASLSATASVYQAALFGDGRPFNVAVIVRAPDASIEQIERDVESVNRNLPDYARVRHWILATEPFSPLNKTATANGRVRRWAIQNRYAPEIEVCYAGAFESYA